uniref:Uncharacterized protein n=1 Tax=Rhizophagus irregularis (strain DAOM 181602 / DAOM 197198 / MUCL 43194) TaxID=747089 RepID=U9TNK8_RHIID
MYNELQNNFHSNSRSITKESQLWMVDQYLKEGSIIANTYEIIRKVNIMIIRETNTTDGIFIKEILYKNLSQGNDLAGVKRHGAIRGCRICLVTKENLTDLILDIASVSRYHHITDSQFKKIFTASTLRQQNNIAKEYAGQTLKLLKVTISMLSPEGERNFISVWKSFEYPRQWSKLPNPISHIETFMMSDRLRLGMPQEIEKLQEQTNMNRNQVISNIIKCWATNEKH